MKGYVKEKGEIEGVVHTVSTKPPELVEPKPTKKNLKILRDILLRARSDEQGGFVSYKGRGKWSFVTGGLGQATPEEWNALMDLAGVVPDKVKSLGSCKDCVHSKKGHPQGWESKHCSCCRGPMSSCFKKRKRRE